MPGGARDPVGLGFTRGVAAPNRGLGQWWLFGTQRPFRGPVWLQRAPAEPRVGAPCDSAPDRLRGARKRRFRCLDDEVVDSLMQEKFASVVRRVAHFCIFPGKTRGGMATIVLQQVGRLLRELMRFECRPINQKDVPGLRRWPRVTRPAGLVPFLTGKHARGMRIAPSMRVC